MQIVIKGILLPGALSIQGQFPLLNQGRLRVEIPNAIPTQIRRHLPSPSLLNGVLVLVSQVLTILEILVEVPGLRITVVGGGRLPIHYLLLRKLLYFPLNPVAHEMALHIVVNNIFIFHVLKTEPL